MVSLNLISSSSSSTSLASTDTLVGSYKSPKSTRYTTPTAKDYSDAFGNLQAHYGFGGTAPTIPSISTTTESSKSKQNSRQSARGGLASRPAKNYEAAFAAMSSSYGFGGSAPGAPTFTIPRSTPTSGFRPSTLKFWKRAT